MSRKKRNNKWEKYLSLVILIIIGICISYIEFKNELEKLNEIENENISYNYDISEIPKYTDKLYIEINDNKPKFKEDEYTTKAFENYSELDSLGRCGVAYANICKEIMPKKR